VVFIFTGLACGTGRKKAPVDTGAIGVDESPVFHREKHLLKPGEKEEMALGLF